MRRTRPDVVNVRFLFRLLCDVYNVNRSVFLTTVPDKWTTVPVLVKIYKLIINELRNQVQLKASADEEEDDEEVGRGFESHLVAELLFSINLEYSVYD